MGVYKEADIMRATTKGKTQNRQIWSAQINVPAPEFKTQERKPRKKKRRRVLKKKKKSITKQASDSRRRRGLRAFLLAAFMPHASPISM